MAKKEMRCWEVSHPDLGKVWVAAESWELATVEAARVWGLPWGKLVAEMRCERSWRAPRNICQRCGRIFNSEGLLCEACKKDSGDRAGADRAAAEKDLVYGGEGGPLRDISKEDKP